MSRNKVPPGQVAGAVLAIGAVLVILFPQHALSVVQLVLMALAAVAGLYALAELAPSSWWASPFEGEERPQPLRAYHDQLSFTESTFTGRRQAIDHGPPLPPATLRLLKPLIGVALSREHLDPKVPAHRDRARRRLSSQTWAVWTAEPVMATSWWSTHRPDPRRVARAVADVLDDLDRFAKHDPLSDPH